MYCVRCMSHCNHLSQASSSALAIVMGLELLPGEDGAISTPSQSLDARAVGTPSSRAGESPLREDQFRTPAKQVLKQPRPTPRSAPASQRRAEKVRGSSNAKQPEVPLMDGATSGGVPSPYRADPDHGMSHRNPKCTLL